MYRAELVKCGFDDALGALGLGNTVIVGGRTATSVPDLLDHLVGHVVAGAGGGTRTAEVVHDDTGALPREGQGVFTAQSPTGSGDDDDAILHSGHQVPLGLLRSRAISVCQNSLRASLRARSV